MKTVISVFKIVVGLETKKKQKGICLFNGFGLYTPCVSGQPGNRKLLYV